MGIEMAENQNVWKYYSNFHDFTADLYNIKLKMRATDLEKKKYFFYHEPEESSETFLKNMHIKKYETIQKWCKSIMVVGWENIIENNLDLIESTHELQNCYRDLVSDKYELAEELKTKLNIHLNAIKPILKKTLEETDKYDESKLSL